MANKLRVVIVASSYNDEVVARLVASAKKTIQEDPSARLEALIWVPGAFEIPLAAQQVALHRKPDAIICLGAILRGRTDQNYYLSHSCYLALQEVQLGAEIPIGLGVLAAPTYRMALARTRGHLDRGREAALAALSMAKLCRELPRGRRGRRPKTLHQAKPLG